MGRPTDYSIDKATEICSLLVTRNPDSNRPRSLRDVCELENMPHEATVYRWLSTHEQFREMYARAREERADMLADDVIDISDTETDAAKARNRMDARKWYAAKLNPKRYGDKVTNELTGPNGAALVPVINVTVGRDQSQPPS